MPVLNQNLKGRPSIIRLNSQAAALEQQTHIHLNQLATKDLQLL